MSSHFRGRSAALRATLATALALVPLGLGAQGYEGLYGDVPVAAGSRGVIAEVAIDAGGGDSAAVFGPDCVGFVNAVQPDLTLTLEGPVIGLRAEAYSAVDTTLVIVAPDGTALCNDDTDTLNPAIEIAKAAPGQYALWIGVIEPTVAASDLVISAGAAGGGGGIAAPSAPAAPAAPPLSDRTLAFEAAPGSAAEARARAIVAAIEETRLIYSDEAGEEIVLSTSRPVGATESGGAVRLEFPDFAAEMAGVRADFGTVVLDLTENADGTTAWSLTPGARVVLSEGGRQLGDLVWSSARIGGLHLDAFDAMIGYDIDMRDVALRFVDEPDTLGIGQIRLELDSDKRSDGLYDARGGLVLQRIAIESTEGRFTIARAGVEGTSSGTDMAGMQALNEAIESGLDPEGDPGEMLATLLPALLSITWGDSDTKFYVEGIDGIDADGTPFRLGRAEMAVGFGAMGDLAEIRLGLALGGLDFDDPTLPPSLRRGDLDIAFALENLPLREMMAAVVGLDPMNPDHQGQIGQIMLGAVMASNPAIRIDRLDLSTPGFGITTKGRLGMAGMFAPEGRFEMRLRGIDTLIADAQTGALGPGVDRDMVAGLIFLQGLGKPAPDGPAGTLVYDIEITPDMAMFVNGIDVSQIAQ